MKLENKTLSLVVDMYGCPNRCKHCWIPHFKNGNMSDEEAEALVNTFKPYFNTIQYFSWAREPDYCMSYRERWEKDIALSVNCIPQRFELASFWRLARDESYVSFLNEVGVKVVQLSFFGLEEKTDYYVGRTGAFKELLKATEILIEHNIAPRWQAFINEENKDEIVELLHLSEELQLKERCEVFNQEFKFFTHPGDCLENNYHLYNIRICEGSVDPCLIPYYQDYNENYSEAVLYEKYKDSLETIDLAMGDHIVLYVFEDGNLYYNYGTFNTHWCIGNWKKDKIEDLLPKIISDDVEAVHIAKKIPIKELVERYGDPTSKRLFYPGDYKMYLLHKHLYSLK